MCDDPSNPLTPMQKYRASFSLVNKKPDSAIKNCKQGCTIRGAHSYVCMGKFKQGNCLNPGNKNSVCKTGTAKFGPTTDTSSRMARIKKIQNRVIVKTNTNRGSFSGTKRGPYAKVNEKSNATNGEPYYPQLFGKRKLGNLSGNKGTSGDYLYFKTVLPRMSYDGIVNSCAGGTYIADKEAAEEELTKQPEVVEEDDCADAAVPVDCEADKAAAKAAEAEAEAVRKMIRVLLNKFPKNSNGDVGADAAADIVEEASKDKEEQEKAAATNEADAKTAGLTHAALILSGLELESQKRIFKKLATENEASQEAAADYLSNEHYHGDGGVNDHTKRVEFLSSLEPGEAAAILAEMVPTAAAEILAVIFSASPDGVKTSAILAEMAATDAAVILADDAFTDDTRATILLASMSDTGSFNVSAAILIEMAYNNAAAILAAMDAPAILEEYGTTDSVAAAQILTIITLAEDGSDKAAAILTDDTFTDTKRAAILSTMTSGPAANILAAMITDKSGVEKASAILKDSTFEQTQQNDILNNMAGDSLDIVGAPKAASMLTSFGDAFVDAWTEQHPLPVAADMLVNTFKTISVYSPLRLLRATLTGIAESLKANAVPNISTFVPTILSLIEPADAVAILKAEVELGGDVFNNSDRAAILVTMDATNAAKMAAARLWSPFDAGEIWAFIGSESAKAVAILAEMDANDAAAILAEMDAAKAAGILKDDAFDDAKRAAILAAITDSAKAAAIQTALDNLQ